MARTHYIAAEGWPLIAAAGMLAAWMIHAGHWLLAAPVLALAGALAYCYREPPRRVSSDPLGVVSPVDGRVVGIARGCDRYLGREAQRVVLRMNGLGSYAVRSPIEGRIMQQWLPGEVQERKGNYAQWIQTDEGEDVALVAQGRHWLIFRPRCYSAAGQRIGQGQRCGFIHFGTLVEVSLPADSRIMVHEGGEVRAGVDVLARLVHAPADNQSRETTL